MHGRDTRRHHQNQGGNYQNYGYSNGRDGGGGGGAPRNHVIPDEPPFTAYIGNAPDTMVQGDFEKHVFTGLKVKQVRLVRDRQTDRFRGFAYVDFEDADSLRRAIEMDGTCINDRPIRIDVAVRPLGASKPEGFRNKPGFDAPDGRRQPPGNNNRPSAGFRQGGRNNNNNTSNYQYNQQGQSRNPNDGYEENQYNDENPAQRNRQSSGSGKTNERYSSQNQPQQQQPKEHKTPPRRGSNDDVFLGPDTPASTEDGGDASHHEEGTAGTGRQQSRNWADCPIDESVVEPTSPPTSANNTFTNDDFQVVRNKNNRPRPNNQQQSARPMGNPPNRGRGGGAGGNNYYRGGGPAQMSGGRGYSDQTSPPYMNQPQQFYQHHQHQAPPPLHMGANYSNNNPRQGGSGNNRQRLNSNRSTNSRSNNDNQERTSVRGDSTSITADDNPVPAENRPRLQLLPRSQKPAPATSDNNQPADSAARNSNIFGSGKPRDERDPKLAEFNKHIEEIVEKEQQLPRTKSTTSNGSNEGVTKPVRILTAATKSSDDH